MKGYPKQHFAVVSGSLRCNACSETLSLKKNSIDKHIKSSKHTNGVARIAKDKKQSQSIMECLKRRDMREHPSGSPSPVDICLFRFEIVECVLTGGIPLSKVDVLRPLLEKYGHRLTHSTNLREIIPVRWQWSITPILQHLLVREIAGGNSVTFNQLMKQAKACISQGLISISRNLVFNFATQSVLLR